MKQHTFDYKTKINIHVFNFNCYLKKKEIIIFEKKTENFLFYSL